MAYILLAEDNIGIREGLEKMLKSLGHTVAAASGPAQAFAILGHPSNTFNLVLTDWRMPHLDDGLHLLQFLNKQGYTGPVIIYSGEEDARHPLSQLRETFNSFASLHWELKPSRKLPALIKECLEKQKPPQ